MKLGAGCWGQALVDDLVVHVLDAHLEDLAGHVAELDLLGLAFLEFVFLKTLSKQLADHCNFFVDEEDLSIRAYEFDYLIGTGKFVYFLHYY